MNTLFSRDTSGETITDMQAIAQQLNAIEPGAGMQAIQNFDFMPSLGIITAIVIGAFFVSQTIVGAFAFNRSKNRLY